MYDFILFLFKCHLASSCTQNHLKRNSLTSSKLKVKWLFISVLLAFSQRNTHFCGCKGTYIM